MENIETFYSRIPQEDKETGVIILYFLYYCEINSLTITPNLIKQCYEKLALKPYSNIAAYMNSKTKKAEKRKTK